MAEDHWRIFRRVHYGKAFAFGVGFALNATFLPGPPQMSGNELGGALTETRCNAEYDQKNDDGTGEKGRPKRNSGQIPLRRQGGNLNF
jgi:hypothetical protein